MEERKKKFLEIFAERLKDFDKYEISLKELIEECKKRGISESLANEFITYFVNRRIITGRLTEEGTKFRITKKGYVYLWIEDMIEKLDDMRKKLLEVV